MIWLADALAWLAARDARFWTLAWLLFGLHVAAFLGPVPSGAGWRRWIRPVAFSGTLLLLIFGFRWPGIAQNEELQNPDESQLIASALTMADTGRYWGRIDGATTGPLAPLPLAVPKLLGFRVDYVCAHAVQAFLLWGAVLCVWRIFAHYFGERAAPWLTLPLTCGVAFTHFWDFVQYSSEQAPIFFIALALWLLCTAFDSVARAIVSPYLLAAAGFVLGLLPFSKLQVVPLGLVIAVTGLVWIASNGEARPARLRAAGLLLGGAAGALLLVALSVVARGGWSDFLETYVRNNLHYTAARLYPWRDFPGALDALVGDSWGFPYFYYACALLVALGLPWWPGLLRERRRILGLTGALFGAGFFVVVAGGHRSQHYLQLLWVPMALHAGVLWGSLANPPPVVRGPSLGWRLLLVWLVFLAVGVGPQLYYRTHDWNPYLEPFRQYRGRMPERRVADRILAFARPGDAMSIWGWAPKFHVQTQLPHATSESNAERQISPGPLRPYFRARFLRELQARPPAIFLDAVGPGNFGYHDRAVDGHETIPELRALVAARYALVDDLEGTRIYVRHDRLKP